MGAAVFGPPLATYTAALVANTAVPAWHEAHRELPFVFAGSGATAAGGLAMLLAPTAQAGPARRMAVAGAGIEIAAAELLVHRLGMVAEPYQQGMPGRLMKHRADDDRRRRRGDRAGRPSFATSSRRSPGPTFVSASLLTRFGVFEAGLASARDPKYVVVPQRERLRQREAARAD